MVSKTNTQQLLWSSNTKYSANSVPKNTNKSASDHQISNSHQILWSSNTKYCVHQILNIHKCHGHQIANTQQILWSPNTKYLANTMVTKINTHQILWSPNNQYKALWSLNTLKKCTPATHDNRQKSSYITNLLVKLSLSGEIHQF